MVSLVIGSTGSRSPRAQRESIQRLLTKANASEPAKGWVRVTTSDDGRMTVHAKYLKDSEDFHTLNILAEALTPEISGLVHKLMQECAFLLVPMAFAASEEVAHS